MRKLGVLACLLAAGCGAAVGQLKDSSLSKDDLTPNFKAPAVVTDYDKRVVMVPMRDGTKLYTVICVPKGAHGCADFADADAL